jgi:hypothetical protein
MFLQMQKGGILAGVACQLPRRARAAIFHGAPEIGAAMPSR